MDDVGLSGESVARLLVVVSVCIAVGVGSSKNVFEALGASLNQLHNFCV